MQHSARRSEVAASWRDAVERCKEIRGLAKEYLLQIATNIPDTDDYNDEERIELEKLQVDNDERTTTIAPLATKVPRQGSLRTLIQPNI